MEMKDVIKMHRTRLELSQRELGDRVGVNKAAVQKWECGKVTNLKNEIIVKLAEIFGISMDELYAVSSTPTPETFQNWDEKYNANGSLADEVAGIEELCILHNKQGGGANISVQFDEKNITTLIKAIYGDQAAKLVEAFATLNQTGKDEALERITELSELPRYSN